MVGVAANWAGDRVLSAEAVRGGSRHYLVVLSLLFTAAGLGLPFAQSLAAVITLITIAISAAHVGPAANGALVADLQRSPGDAGRATAFLVLGGNTFGLLRRGLAAERRRGPVFGDRPKARPFWSSASRPFMAYSSC